MSFKEGCIGNEEKLFQRAFEHLVLGGYIEFQAAYAEFKSDDGTVEKAVHTLRWMELMTGGARQFGKPWDTASKWKDKLEAAGFVDVQQEVRKLPIGTWPKDPKLKEVGGAQSVHELQVVDSYTPGILSRILGWDEKEIQAFTA